ncbi:unnamed protein product, partial [Brassica rapa]
IQWLNLFTFYFTMVILLDVEIEFSLGLRFGFCFGNRVQNAEELELLNRWCSDKVMFLIL